MRKILVLRGGALGDFIVTLPALALLRGRWPSARIELAGNATAGALARDHGLLDAVHSQHEARWAALFDPAPLPAEFARWLGGFDLVLNFWPDPDGALRSKFPRRADQMFLHGEAHPTHAPAAAHYCEALRPLGLTTSEFCFRISPPARPIRRVAIHPGSGSPLKNWPLDRWTALAQWLVREQRCELCVVTGEAEPEAARSLGRFGRSLHSLSLGELARELSQCRLLIGHDSGVTHLASMMSVPCVALFGPTDPAIWAPPGPAVHVIQRDRDLRLISVDVVQEAIGRILKNSAGQIGHALS